MIKNENTSISSVLEKDTVIGKIKKGLVIVYEAWKKLKLSGIPPLTLPKCKGVPLIDYKIYGESVQEGTPTPDTPIEIESVGEKTINLLNKATSNVGYTINPAGVVSIAKYGLTVTEPIFVSPNTKYIYSGMGDVVGTTVARTGYMYEEDGTPIQAISSSNGVNVYFTTTENCAYIRLIYKSNEEEPMLKLQGLTSTDYEPYGYKIPVKVSGKNLFDYESFYSNTTNFDITDGVVSGKNNAFSSSRYYIPQELVGKQLTFSADIKTDSTFDGVYLMTMVNGTRLDGNVIKGNVFKKSSVTFTPTSTNDWIRITYGSDINAISYAKNIQLEVSENVTEYEPYIEPVTTNIYLNEPLRKIGDYADYIDFENKKSVRNIKELNLKDLSWAYNSGSKIFAVRLNDGISRNALQTNASYCTHYPLFVGSFNEMPNKSFQNPSNYWSSYNYVVIKDEDYIDTTTFKEHLTNNNVMLSYILAEPVEEPIELPNMPTHKGTTIIEVDTSILPSNMEVVYKGKEV